MLDFAIFLISLVLVAKSADSAMGYSSRIAKDLNISKHLVGFLIIAIISVIPELSISVISSLKNESSFALGTLFGSNVADLTLIMAIIILFAHRSVKVKSKIVNNGYLYLLTMSVPLLLGLDGIYGRGEGVVLIGLGILFYYWLLKKDREIYNEVRYSFSVKNLLFLIGSMALLLIGAYLTVEHGIQLAHRLNIPPVLVGLFGVSLGTTLPELFFSVKAVRKHQDELALGDILGTVISDAVIVVGLIALINPFEFPVKIVYLTGIFMITAAALLFHLMRTDRSLSTREALLLIAFYLGFICAESYFNLLA